jgi:ATP-binding cassette subfamily B (MDR/TAP) protein 1
VLTLIALIFWYGARIVAAGEWDIHSIVTVFTMLIFTLANVNAIQAFIPQISSSRDTASRLIRLTQLPYMASHEHSGQIRVKTLPGTITFNNVTFAYPTRPDEPVLKLFSLRIPLHTSVALASGSGKSTVTALLLGLYPAWTPKKKGSAVPSRRASVTNLSRHSSTFSTQALKLGTFSLKDLHLPSYRSLVALVRQQTVLFPGTIAENITYGLPFESSYRSQSAIELAASLAGIDGFINSLPSAYSTIVGDGGTTLSGGQTQRIGIARALVRQPELLIMDEPTSSLDAESAQEIRATITGLVNRERRAGERGTTVVVVTHAWEMMRDMGRCVVLDGGRVVEDGRFEDLMRSSDGVLREILGRGE